jgi:hypothetical protein
MTSQDTEQSLKEAHSKKWKTEKILETYADADSYRESLISQDPSDDFLVKIRRCGPGGSRFKVKSWFPPDIKNKNTKKKQKNRKK